MSARRRTRVSPWRMVFGHSVRPRADRRGAALALALLLMLAVAPALARAETLALTGATVHTVSGPTLEHATVVVRDGRILAVGTDVRPPEGATVVPCEGRHVYPGMISANTVLGLIEVSSVTGTNDWQETGPTNPNIRGEVGVNPESELLPVTRLNGITSAVVVPRGGSICGTSALLHLDGWTYEDMAVRAPLGLHVQWPNMTPVRTFNEVRPDEEQTKARDQAVEAIRKGFDDARAYWKARDAEGKSGIPRHDRDVKWDAMGKALRGEIPVMFHANALNQIRAVLKFVDDEKLPHVVIVGGADAWRVADALKERHIAVIAGPMLALPRHDSDAYDAAFTGPAKLYEAGVPFCIGDGGSAFGAYLSRNLPYHAAMAAAFGLPKDEALKAVTLYPARILGVEKDLGSIEVGKIADLIVTDGDPLEITTTVSQVYIAGRAEPMESRQTRLFHKYDAKPRGALAHKRDGTTTMQQR